ncbi:MAG: large conductance mechanosensitive channel protein MscL [Chitinophagaceae bacterium]|nr:large conductance mechanosensitive channel protein MscL [Chitinophagaceae bacterium]
MGLLREFRAFAMKGNIIDLAVAVIIGAAFGKIITALVDNILMPVIGSFIGSSFATLSTTVHGVEIKYGLFLQAALDFIIVAFVLFLVIRTMNNMKKKKIEAIPEVSSTDKLLMQIRDSINNNKDNIPKPGTGNSQSI